MNTLPLLLAVLIAIPQPHDVPKSMVCKKAARFERMLTNDLEMYVCRDREIVCAILVDPNGGANSVNCVERK